MSQYILNKEQFAFMQAHHELIETALIQIELGNDDPLDTFIASPEYQLTFPDMCWDDVLDRYEDTEGYDNSLRIQLRKQLAEDVHAGRVKILQRRKPKSVPKEDTESAILLDRFIKLTQEYLDSL